MTDTTFVNQTTETDAAWFNDVNDVVYDATKVSVTAPITKTGTTLNGGITIAVTAASDTAAGVIELATAAEVTTGTDTTRAVTPAGAKVELDKKLVIENNLSDLASVFTARANLFLGTAATLNVGTSASQIVQLDGTAKLPAVDGSQLTGLSSTIQTVAVTTGTTNLTASHRGKLIKCNTSGGDITLTLDAAATLADGWWCIVEKTTSDTGTVTINPNASETWGGATTRVLRTLNDYSEGVCDGSNFNEVSRAGTIIKIVETVLSAVATGTTIIPQDDSIPQITEGDQFLSLSITPTSAGSLLLVEIGVMMSHSASSWLTAAVFRDATASALSSTLFRGDTPAGIYRGSLSFSVAATAATATTFTVRAGGHAAGTTTFNGSAGARFHGGVINSFIRITEYRP